MARFSNLILSHEMHIPFQIRHIKAEKLRAQARDYVIIVLGIALYSIGFTVFILPHNIVVGGMAGFATLVYYASFKAFPVAVTMYVTNCLLLVLGWRTLGKGFVVRTIFGMTVLSLMIGSIEGYFTSHPPLVTSELMSVAVGAVFCGFGIGLYYSHGGTSGGTDIVAALLSHKTDMSLGRVLMIVDVSIVALSFFLPFDGDMELRVQSRIETILLGWLCIAIYSMIADKYVGLESRTVQFIILSDAWEKICYRITHETGRGVTCWDGTGYWTGNVHKMMIVWCRQRDMQMIYRIAYECDPHAYITNSYVDSVYGNGFDVLRIKRKN